MLFFLPLQQREIVMKILFFFGDSITLGVNDPQGGGWTGRLAASCTGMSGMPVPPTTFYNLGVRKQSSRLIAERWETEYLQRKIEEAEDHLVFCFGTVDMAAPNGTPLMSIPDSVGVARTILSNAQKRGPVLMLCPPPVAEVAHRERLGQLAKAYVELCATMNISCLNLFEKLNHSESFMNDLSDGVHPGAVGNALVADLLLHCQTMQEWIHQ